ncbi:hypothetical protein M758_3G256400 [Ceratodon purpureus]|nr:hypothetical protein M758_3G256400 [Ceratodon purpureus]
MVYGSAAVMPTSNNEITEAHVEGGNVNTSLPRMPQTTGLVSVQSDPSVLTTAKPKAQKHRRYNSLFSVFSSDHSSPGSSESPSSSTTLKKTSSGITSGRLKWDWKLGDLWHSRSGKLDAPTVDIPVTQLESASSVDSIAGSEKNVALSRNGSREGGGNGSLHYTSLGIFQSSKYSSSDLETSDRSGNSSQEYVEVESRRIPLATRWREIQGVNNWENLLDPLDPDLRVELLRYGDIAQMAYDNFEDNNWSKYAGSAKYSKKTLFEKLGKAGMGYQVTRYLYATCENPLPGILQSSLSSEKWDVESNWMGFVAVATDEREIARLGRRDIVVSWRGTMRTMEWLVDAQIQMAPMTVAPDPQARDSSLKPSILKPKVEKGFWSLYTCKRSASQFNQKSASEQVMRELIRLLTLYKGETLSITLTGHSLGGALAILTAYEIAERGLNKQTTKNGTDETIPVTVISFGSPRIGDAVFKRRFEELQLKALRVVNIHDVVPKSIGGLHPPWSETYKHVGVEFQLDSKLSTYLKRSRDPIDWHSLECYLHHVDGYQGAKSKEFKLMTGRDIALVNKYCDVLKTEHCIPAYWWQSENKGLVLSDEGKWVEPDRPIEDMPSLDNKENFI